MKAATARTFYELAEEALGISTQKLEETFSLGELSQVTVGTGGGSYAFGTSRRCCIGCVRAAV